MEKMEENDLTLDTSNVPQHQSQGDDVASIKKLAMKCSLESDELRNIMSNDDPFEKEFETKVTDL